MLLLVLLLALNFAISWWNCYAVGGIWAESAALGGWPRVLAWCGATQAAVGFSSVIGFALGAILHAAGVLPPKVAQGAAAIWYLLIIVPAIGTGLVITIHSWIAAFRERSLMNMGAAAYNTVAMAHNIYSAVDGVGEAVASIRELMSSDDDGEGSGVALAALVLALAALASGVLLTVALIRRYAGRLPLPARTAGAAA